ncbi:MAG: IS481 family transposase, partial [Candidatus Limnocylindria bacterium]
LEVLLEPERTGDTVAEVCRRRAISRASFYRYRRRYLEEGLAGLEPRSRRPRGSPGQIPAELEAEIVALRKKHLRWGARRIHAELARAGLEPPAVATIHRALERNHLVAPQPPRRRRARKRFERPVPNDLWQIDGTQVELAGGEHVWVVDVLDDHARYLLAALACTSPTGEAAWACFAQASALYGLPRQLLSDNHMSFTGRLFGLEVAFERKLAETGVELINAAPAHPETLGKLERFHRTLKESLADEGPPADLDHLQLLLDRFRGHYNGERPHQGIGNRTPAERYLPIPAPAVPLGELALAEGEKHPPYPPHAATRKVDRNGIVSYDGLGIIVPHRFAGATVRVLEIGELIHLYLGEELVRVLVPDRTKRFQKLGKRRERRP